MKKNITFSLLLIASMLIMAACASLKLPGTNQDSTAAIGTPGAFDPRTMPLEMKLAVGTFKLDKTDLAVTPDQAKDLLPLWKAVKSLSTSQTASQEELDGLYAQIKETMTAEQVAAVDKMEFTSDDTNALMKELGIQMPQGGGNFQNLSSDERATQIAQFRAQNPNAGQGQGRQGGGPGFAPGGGGLPSEGGANMRPTPQPGQQTVRRGLGFNTIFIDPLIKMLETRAGG